MTDKSLGIDLSGFTQIPCDKCGSCSMYSEPQEVTECFGCKCKRLEEMNIDCACGWSGNYFEQDCSAPDAPRTCPGCGKIGYNEPPHNAQEE